MSLVAMGTSFKTASIDERQRVAVPEPDLDAALAALAGAEGVKEAVLLSTCNRVEAYVEAKTDRLGADAAEAFFRSRAGDALDAGGFYLHRGPDAVQHAFRVVCSLDSQVLGEAQILGQMRSAFERAQAAGTCGEVLAELFKRALSLGKRVRAETAIGSDPISLATVAHRVACRSRDDLASCRVLLAGAGEMARLAARYLADDGVGELLVANRTPGRAIQLAAEAGGRAVPFERLHDEVAACDVAFFMTGSEEPVLRADGLRRARAAAGREEAPLVLIDEAVPRDVEPACATLPGVELHDLESLTAIVDGGLATRMAAVPEAERLAAEAEQGFLAWMQERLVTPTIKAMYEKGSLTVEDELAHALSALARERGATVDPGERRILEAYGNAIMKKLLHGPTARLRKEARTADSYYYTGAARYLFGIETFPPGTRRACHGHACEEGAACPLGLAGASRAACLAGSGRA